MTNVTANTENQLIC